MAQVLIQELAAGCQKAATCKQKPQIVREMMNLSANCNSSDGAGGRTLSNGIGSIPASGMTVAKCLAACRAGNYKLGGVEYGGECCGCSPRRA